MDQKDQRKLNRKQYPLDHSRDIGELLGMVKDLAKEYGVKIKSTSYYN